MSDRSVDDVAEALARMRSSAQVKDFMQAILTPAERKRIGLRWKLVCMLRRGEKQRDISDALGVSLCKITRGSRELKKGPVSFRRAVDDFLKRRRAKGKGDRNE